MIKLKYVKNLLDGIAQYPNKYVGICDFLLSSEVNIVAFDTTFKEIITNNKRNQILQINWNIFKLPRRYEKEIIMLTFKL